MALNGSAYTGFAKHRLVIEWSASQSIPNNNSSVVARVYLQSMDGYGQLWAPAMNNGSITVNGQTQTFSANSDLRAYQKKLLATRTFNVPHNADGSKSFSFSATYFVNVTFAGTFYGNRTASGSNTLNAIPRASSVSLSASNINLGTATTINIARASNGFTHTVTYKNGSYTKVITTKTSSVSFKYTPEVAIANQFRNSTWATGTITCDTYNGNTRIGTSSVKLTVKTVANATFNPTINSVVLSETAKEVTSAFGAVYLQNRSRIRAVSNTSGKFGAGLKSMTVSIGKTSLNGRDVVSGAINESGTLTVRSVLVDTRGYSATHTQTITLLPYANPRVNSFTAERRESAQEIVDFNWKATTVAVQSNNTMGYKLEWKKNTSNAWVVLASSSSATQTDWAGSKIQAGTDVGSSYDVRLSVYDKLMTVVSVYQVATATVPMSWGTDGTAIGKVYEEGKETFQVRGSGFYEGMLRTARDTYAGQGGALNLNNSDMVGLNAVYFGATVGTIDPADNDGEGLLFPHSKTIIPADGKINRNAGWDTFRIQDGIVYLNSVPIANDGKALWEGAMYIDHRHTITPSIPIRDCPNGWALVWSYYGTTTEDHNFITTFSHKVEASMAGGANHPIISQRGDIGAKYIYVKPTTLVGHANNSGSTSKVGNYVLRWVYAW